jgi:hypothetical protein
MSADGRPLNPLLDDERVYRFSVVGYGLASDLTGRMTW